MTTFLVVLSTIGTAVEAQQASQYPDRFNDPASCSTALVAGQSRFYVPSFLKPVPLKAGEEERPLEHNACARMQIVGRIAWVPQPVGTCMVFKNGVPVRRCDCGNKVYGIVYPTVAPATPEPAPQPALQTFTERLMRPVEVNAQVSADVMHHFSDTLNVNLIQAQQPRSWWSRNWGWVVAPPLIVGAAAAVYCLWINEDACRSTNVQETIIKAPPQEALVPRLRWD